MKSIVARNPQDSLSSFSRRNFSSSWENINPGEDNKEASSPVEGLFRRSFSYSRGFLTWKKKPDADDDDEEILTAGNHNSSSQIPHHQELDSNVPEAERKKKLRFLLSVPSVSRFFSSAFKFRGERESAIVVGTIFGFRRGRATLAFQEDPPSRLSPPELLVELPIRTSVLVGEMASGFVGIALECNKTDANDKGKLVEEPIWKTYCNGRRCGKAKRRECGGEAWKVLNTIGPVTMGAGVLPPSSSSLLYHHQEGEMMYMRAKFERALTRSSHDSQAFHKLKPAGGHARGGPELSIFFMRH